MKEFLKNMKWFSQGALRMEYLGKVIYTDPFEIDAVYADADYIFLSHDHFDHISEEDIQKVIKGDTVFVLPVSCRDAEGLRKFHSHVMKTVNPFDTVDFPEFSVRAVPAYNIVKTDCHPKSKNWVGYVFSFGEVSLYYTSDTERIPEMKDIRADIICLPLGQTYTFESVDDAVGAVLDTCAKVAIPIHYGRFEGTKEDAEYFKKQLPEKAVLL